jgi:AcrR family transcriptional regulator
VVGRSRLEEIAERAGYTRGAIYANFADKDELFLTLVERHKGAFVDAFERAAALASTQERLAEVQALLAGGPPGLVADWTVLWAEVWLHAARHPQLAERLAEQERRYRGAVARLLAIVAADLGVELSASVEELAAEVIALDVGLALQRRLVAATLLVAATVLLLGASSPP